MPDEANIRALKEGLKKEAEDLVSPLRRNPKPNPKKIMTEEEKKHLDESERAKDDLPF